MVFTNYGRSGAALLFCGSVNVPQYLAIGSGSGAVLATNGSLVAEVLSARVSKTSGDISVARELTMIFDINSVNMSGLSLREFGVGGVTTVGTQDLWIREGFPAITFDGTNELEVQVTFQTF